MRYLRTDDVPLAEIEVGERLRPVDPEEVARVRVSMAEIGQLTPIEVVEQLAIERLGGGRCYRLVAGAHRHAAATALGWPSIRAEIKQPETDQPALELELHEIDENLGRHELAALDRAVFVGRRRDVHQALHGEQRGGDRKSLKSQGKIKRENITLLIGPETAALLGRSERLVKRALRIYDRLAPEVRHRLRGTPLSLIERELYDLTRLTPDEQMWVVDNIVGRGLEPSVKRALAIMRGERASPLPPHEAEAERLRRAWARAGRRARRAHLDMLTEMGIIPTYDPDRL